MIQIDFVEFTIHTRNDSLIRLIRRSTNYIDITVRVPDNLHLSQTIKF